jgi:outer membrane protein OmpA-like peptidoglycan-associated protein
MQLINGRTPEQWRAFDRWKLIVALVLAALLIVLWVAGAGPGRATACCGVPETGPAAPAAAAVAPPEMPTPATASPAAPEAPDAAPVPGPPEADCPELSSMRILFASNSASITAEGLETLERLTPCLGGGRYEVAGHADSSGNDAINDPLAEARARAVVDFLAAHGVDTTRLHAQGYGSNRPVADNATLEGRARNRRVEIRPR